MISSEILNLLNTQITKEFYSAYFYLMVAANFERRGLKGFANWNRVQAQEEIDHGMILFNYVLECDGKVDFSEISAPICESKTPTEMFERIFALEKEITQAVNNVTYQTMEECDLATRTFIEWYITEQIEEEHNVSDILKKLQLIGDDTAALLFYDHELGQREYKHHSYN